ncbi:MAG: 2'-5' RNA ligase family protein [Anaerolineae bacterium]|jgi:2'-5' RNA ligase|nr:2'-5' RNA ligase family protein [Anaerolineae bacterium]MBT4312404.1 2'-5' RNA ligase family protein [Anaerolineae bacterium]MBT6321531.1 2'-5' RNA ligase family protein [Anaerolineae bacterium]MBT7773206.1 2'-5' RNA ligase family protein [Anaerolineae bacterium]
MLHQVPTTIPSEIRDYPEWRRGRESYAVWVLRCDQSRALQNKFNAARAHLNGYLLEPYPRQPHITLFVCGFLVDEVRYNDDFTQTQVDAQVRALETANIHSFEIEIGGMNSFASAPFLEIHDPEGGIPHLREVLSRGAPEFRTAPHRPHLTIGLYADAFPSKEVLERMAAFSSEPLRWPVEQVTLSTYRAEEIAGELRFEYKHWLKS